MNGVIIFGEKYAINISYPAVPRVGQRASIPLDWGRLEGVISSVMPDGRIFVDEFEIHQDTLEKLLEDLKSVNVRELFGI